jgi:cephalosporin hydroxylase
MSADSEFRDSVAANISALRDDATLKSQSLAWLAASAARRYSYNFRWMGRPIIQYPQDMIAMQEILWDVRPDLIIETGIAHGGSLVYYASLCQLMGHGEVLGIDIDIRPHNRAAIESHPMAGRIRMLEGSSIDAGMVERVREAARGKRVLVVLDSNHTHAHVLAELEAYAPLVSVGSYCVVFDTVVEDMPSDAFPDRPWGVGDNPKTAVHAFLARDDRFEIDRDIEAKIQVTVAPDGYLKRVR